MLCYEVYCKLQKADYENYQRTKASPVGDTNCVVCLKPHRYDCKQCVNENHQNNQQSSFHQTNLCHSQAVTWLITCCMCVNIQWNSEKKKTSSLWSRQKPQMPGCTRQVNHQQWQQHRTAREGVHTGNRRCEASLAVWEQIKDKTQVFFHLPSETTHTPT